MARFAKLLMLTDKILIWFLDIKFKNLKQLYTYFARYSYGHTFLLYLVYAWRLNVGAKVHVGRYIIWMVNLAGYVCINGCLLYNCIASCIIGHPVDQPSTHCHQLCNWDGDLAIPICNQAKLNLICPIAQPDSCPDV